MPIMSSQSELHTLESLHKIQSTKLTGTPIVMRKLSVGLVLLVFLSLLLLAFAPWQQSVSGVGEVSTRNPMHRPQTVMAPIDARIKEWLVAEGQWVKAGQPLLELDEIKAYYLDDEQLNKMLAMRDAQEAQITATQSTIEALEAQESAVSNSRDYVVPEAEAKRQESQFKIRAAQQKVLANQKELQTADFYEKRIRKLYNEDLKSKRDLEVAENRLVKAQSDLTASQADLKGAEQSFQGATYSVGKSNLDVDTKQSETASKLAKARQDYAKAQAELVKLDNEIVNLQERQSQRIIKSPVEGRLVRANVYGAGQTIKEGDELGVVVPDAGDRMVTLFLTDVDAPLVSVGRQVRLQFAGYPAVQFSGWPKVAMGTYAGRVVVIDAVDDGQNRFRVLVEPDQKAINSHQEEEWPEDQHLRYGTQAIGWVMLDEVPLGYELWRRFNGFELNLKKKPPPVNSALDNVKKETDGYYAKTGKENGNYDKSKKFGGIKSKVGKAK
ncbi:MAG: HlyD family efflux transporter periplasmic adaptor subunit [Vampirovibrionales bacterium]|jgi:multidrug efflux pump subunit AcrA (membrane-fusion protein)|nr:HlyD family efflux transporter periplasmic adaptor subunit [Vampirovibrionales bacterium]